MCATAAAIQAADNGLAGWLCTQNSPNTPVCSWDRVTCDSSIVTKINFLFKGLLGTIPSVLGTLSSINELGLSYNKLAGTILTSLGGMSSLTYLSVGASKVAGTIPASLGSLSALIYLDLNTNLLGG